MVSRHDALAYHEHPRPGKIEVVPTKPSQTQRDLALAYTPGVAAPCREIAADPDSAYRYTGRGNLVGVITNGTAVLGLGRIGPLAGKPVMEGKAVLFKRFADIDVFDIEVDTTDREEFVRLVRLLEPTFGGINLEDIAAPDCFWIEEQLTASMNIPVFHDDQHGTAIIAAAALLNGAELAGKRLEDLRIVFSGAGASAIACARLLLSLGVHREQIILCDSHGVVFRGRDGLNRYKEEFATDAGCRTLAEALRGADVFIGLSGPDLVTPEMVVSMADAPLVLALANPDPEISYPEAKGARSDVIVATGRSDYPNQVNNVLGFPFIFRGALDVRARRIDEAMKLAAVRALSALAKESVPDAVARAYGATGLRFGPDYIIPKPFDPRVLVQVSSAVAEAAMRSGTAGRTLDVAEYREALESRLGPGRETMRLIVHSARRDPRPIVFPEGTHPKIVSAAVECVGSRLARPILIGNPVAIRAVAASREVSLDGITIVDPAASDRRASYEKELLRCRERKGVILEDARRLVLDPNIFGALMLRAGDAEGLISGVSQHYPDTMRPMLRIVGRRPGVRHVAGVFVLSFRQRSILIADATVNVQPDAETLAEIALHAAAVARRFRIEPRVAMLSFSNFGSVDSPLTRLPREAARLLKEREPDLVVDGEMQADTAVVPALARGLFPFSAIQGDATVLVFPDLTSGNISYKLLDRIGGAEVIGPILVGMNRPVHVLHQANEVSDIINLTALAVAEAQDRRS